MFDRMKQFEQIAREQAENRRCIWVLLGAAVLLFRSLLIFNWRLLLLLRSCHCAA
jgi:hypothetical protein